jgi:hypothetical protein
MSQQYKRLKGADALKAPAGQFRIVLTRRVLRGVTEVPLHFLVGERTDQGEALHDWQKIVYEDRDRDNAYRIYNDQGREIGVLGQRISEDEFAAPAGRFRVICVDLVPTMGMSGGAQEYWLLDDLSEKDKACELARGSNQGPYARFQVYDDSGTMLLHV